MEVLIWISGISSIVAIPLAIIIACIQTIRLKKLKNKEYRDTWKLIGDVRSLLGKTKKRADIEGDDGAHEMTKTIFRHLLKNAAELEENYTEDTIGKWIEEDKIGNTDWQKGIAKSYLINPKK